jgi:hypothetical protein
MTVTHHTGEERPANLMAQLSYAKILFARKHYSAPRARAIQAAHALRHALRAAVGAVPPVRRRWTGRVAAERHALAVVLGRTPPPFGSGSGAGAEPGAGAGSGAGAEVLPPGAGSEGLRSGVEGAG